jgi:hypothetical protein
VAEGEIVRFIAGRLGSTTKTESFLSGKVRIYANNRDARYGPATVEMFRSLWRSEVKEEARRLRPLKRE